MLRVSVCHSTMYEEVRKEIEEPLLVQSTYLCACARSTTEDGACYFKCLKLNGRIRYNTALNGVCECNKT